MTGPRRLGVPRHVRVRAAATGAPISVDGEAVDGVRESWLVEDRWWTPEPLRRRYWEVVTVPGRDLVVFHDLEGGGWWAQRLAGIHRALATLGAWPSSPGMQ